MRLPIRDTEVVTRRVSDPKGEYQAFLEVNPGFSEFGQTRAEAYGRVAIRLHDESPETKITGHISADR